VLSTLPDNPGDSRFWTVSSGLQIRVWYLPDNRQSWYFCRLDFPTIKFQIFCVVCATVNMERVPRHCNLRNNVAKYELSVCYIRRSESTSIFGIKWRHLSCDMTSYIIPSLFLLNIWWSGGVDSPAILTLVRCSWTTSIELASLVMFRVKAQ